MAKKKPGAWDVVSTAPVNDGWNVVSTAPIPQQKPVDTHGVSLSAAPPQTAMQRFKNMIANSAIGHAVEASLPRVANALDLHPTTAYGADYDRQGQQLVSPEELMPGNPTSVAGQLAKGALRGTGEMTSAPSLATGTALAATGGIAGAALPAAATAIKLGGAGAGAYQTFKGLHDAYKLKQQGAPTGDAVEAAGSVIPGAVATLPAAGDVLKLGGKGAQAAGEGIISKGVVGARQSDVARGASPGRGYFQSGRGPSFSMEGIADRAGRGMQSTSDKLQAAYSAADASDKRIPVQAVRDALQSTIGNAWQSMSKAGGTGDTGSLAKFAATFEPELQEAERRGGFTPSELWEIRRNIDKNTTWGDPSKLNMTKIQQQTSGALGGLLKEAVPETVALNDAYRNQLKLKNRAEQRAATGQKSLTGLALKGAMGAGGALAGAVHGGVEGTLGGLGVMALDTVPVKTATAAALHGAGELAEGAGNLADKVPDPVATGLAGAAAAPKDDDQEFKVTQTSPTHFEGPSVVPVAAGSAAATHLEDVPGDGKVQQVGDADHDDSSEKPLNQSAPPTGEYSPSSHDFSIRQWVQANPDGNPDDARESAEQLGYTVVE